jgi:hypothetical protein
MDDGTEEAGASKIFSIKPMTLTPAFSLDGKGAEGLALT